MAAPDRRYVAFLRGINVGGHTVRMEALRAIFASMGLCGAETFIASGNVIFLSKPADVPALERRIEQQLQQALGYEVGTFVRSIEEVRQIARFEPFADAHTGTVHILFLAAPAPAAGRKRLLEFTGDGDAFAVKGREIYWLRRGKLLEGPFSNAEWARITGGPTTMRNRNTIVRIAAKYGT